LQVTYVGHASVIFESGGVRLLTDPILRPRVFHLINRFAHHQPILEQEISAVLISHTHRDHFDIPSLERLGKSTRVILPRGEAARLRERGFENVEELSPGETTQAGALTIQATYAKHGHSRFALVREIDCLGYIVRGDQTVYFAGDTDLFPGMAQIGENLDVAMLPVWGWGPNLGPGHMDPYRAAQALQLLKPRLAIPIHWGTLYPLGFLPSRSRFLIDPPNLFATFAAKLAPEVKVQILAPGEKISVQRDISSEL
jgi:L-ascorbate metabolism protein UlaG (beta-lactamase superfamily)